jgi:NAD(P)-dependent dehydrogenase (short-subunit alcohol dehydrogenase family)
MARLAGKVALVTGATSGIGRAAALLYAEEGASVVLGGRRETEGEALVAEIKGRSGHAVFRSTDVRRRGDADALVELALSTFGRLDIAFNNAGVEAVGSIVDVTDDDYDRVFDTNVRGVVHSVRAQAPAMKAKGGVIVVTSSTAGSRGFAGASLYTASKHAVEGLGRALALELAPWRIRVNVVAPGPTDTAMLDRFTGGDPGRLAARIPLGRAATAEEVARAAVWLATDEAAFVSGVVLPVNGGLTAA